MQCDCQLSSCHQTSRNFSKLPTVSPHIWCAHNLQGTGVTQSASSKHNSVHGFPLFPIYAEEGNLWEEGDKITCSQLL